MTFSCRCCELLEVFYLISVAVVMSRIRKTENWTNPMQVLDVRYCDVSKDILRGKEIALAEHDFVLVAM